MENCDLLHGMLQCHGDWMLAYDGHCLRWYVQLMLQVNGQAIQQWRYCY